MLNWLSEARTACLHCVVLHSSSIMFLDPASSCSKRQELLQSHPMQTSDHELPQAYRWDDELQVGYDAYREDRQLPTIDLSCSADVCKRLIQGACREWGAFQVVNHGVCEQVITRARSKAMELFELPECAKLRAQRAPSALFGYGATRMASFFRRLMWSQAFTMKGSPDSNMQHYATTLWTTAAGAADFWCFQDYDAAMRRLATLLANLVLQALGATPEQVESTTSSLWASIHMNYYPPCPCPLQAMGLAAHTDSSCLTIMHQGDVGGLQVKKGDEWIAVRPHWDAFVVQVGDMLQVMSNGDFKSVEHRAVVNDRFTRLSLVYFLSPPPLLNVVPIGPGRPLYQCLTWNDYLQAKAKYFTGTLDKFTLPK